MLQRKGLSKNRKPGKFLIRFFWEQLCLISRIPWLNQWFMNWKVSNWFLNFFVGRRVTVVYLHYLFVNLYAECVTSLLLFFLEGRGWTRMSSEVMFIWLFVGGVSCVTHINVKSCCYTTEGLKRVNMGACKFGVNIG